MSKQDFIPGLLKLPESFYKIRVFQMKPGVCHDQPGLKTMMDGSGNVFILSKNRLFTNMPYSTTFLGQLRDSSKLLIIVNALMRMGYVSEEDARTVINAVEEAKVNLVQQQDAITLCHLSDKYNFPVSKAVRKKLGLPSQPGAR